ncbi:WG repeat-containing protein [Sphingobacterium spiritivorum]|uniref:WG repeat-containing protein n=2 Tax=Sphingobacterium spiritivorum TaxID=258 RepID=UPI003DA3AC7F
MMKISISVLFLLFLSQINTQAQTDVWQIHLEAKGTKPAEWWTARTGQYVAEFEQNIAEAFYPESKPADFKEKIWISKYKSRVIKGKDEAQFLYVYPKKEVYAFQKGDDIITKDALPDPYRIIKAADVKNIGDDVSYLIISPADEVRDIQGYTCQKYKLNFGQHGFGEVNYQVWCAKDIPAYASDNLPFANHLPGAILQFDLDGQDSTVGFAATKVERMSANPSYFELPSEMEIVDVQDTGDGLSSGGELLAVFNSGLQLEEAVQWFPDNRDGNVVIGLKNKSGEILLPANYQTIENLTEEVAAVTDLDQKYWLVRKDGKVLNTSGYNHFQPVNDQVYSYQIDTNFGLADIGGKVLIDSLEDMQPLNSEYVFAKKDGQYGVIDLDGKFIVKPSYQSVKWNAAGELNLVEKEGEKKATTISASDFIGSFIK